MKILSLVALAGVALLLAACPCPPSDSRCNSGVGGGSGGGGATGGGGAMVDRYTRTVVDPKISDTTYLGMAVDKTRDRVGIAYLSGTGANRPMYTDAGIVVDGGAAPTYEVRYVEWNNGVASQPEVVDQVQRFVGVAIALNPVNGEPAVAYLGGGADMSLYWFQSDGVVATRAGGTWTKHVIARNGMMVTCGNPVSDNGMIVGLWPALGYDSTGGLHYCYRDVHTGQYPQGDWNGSDVECWFGTPPAMAGTCVKGGGNDKNAWGGRIQMVMVNDQPTIIFDQVFGGADSSGQNVFIESRNANGTWSPITSVISIGSTQTGATIAYDPTEGFGIATLDALTNVLFYSNKPPTSAGFVSADEVYGSGSGGWYPSIAMDPVNHEPAIAYYVCTLRPGATPSGCDDEFNQLRIAQRIGGNWREEAVDEDPGMVLRLGFLPVSGKRVLVYRHRDSGAVKVAVEK